MIVFATSRLKQKGIRGASFSNAQAGEAGKLLAYRGGRTTHIARLRWKGLVLVLLLASPVRGESARNYLDDRFFKDEVYAQLDKSGKVDGGHIDKKSLGGRVLTREEVAKIAQEKMIMAAAGVGIPEQGITRAIFEGRYNPYYPDFELAYEGFGAIPPSRIPPTVMRRNDADWIRIMNLARPTEDYRSELWNARFGSLATLGTIRTFVHDHWETLTAKDIALRLIMRTEVFFKKTYGMERDAGFRHDEFRSRLSEEKVGDFDDAVRWCLSYTNVFRYFYYLSADPQSPFHLLKDYEALRARYRRHRAQVSLARSKYIGKEEQMPPDVAPTPLEKALNLAILGEWREALQSVLVKSAPENRLYVNDLLMMFRHSIVDDNHSAQPPEWAYVISRQLAEEGYIAAGLLAAESKISYDGTRITWAGGEVELKYLRAAADYGIPVACLYLGELAGQGKIPGGVAEAKRWFKRGGRMRSRECTARLALLQIREKQRGGEAWTDAEAKPIEWLASESANQFSPLGLYLYAELLNNVISEDRGDSWAADWYIRAVRAGHFSALRWCKEHSVEGARARQILQSSAKLLAIKSPEACWAKESAEVIIVESSAGRVLAGKNDSHLTSASEAPKKRSKSRRHRARRRGKNSTPPKPEHTIGEAQEKKEVGKVDLRDYETIYVD